MTYYDDMTTEELKRCYSYFIHKKVKHLLNESDKIDIVTVKELIRGRLHSGGRKKE